MGKRSTVLSWFLSWLLYNTSFLWSGLRLGLVSVTALLMLSGCVNYEVGLNFNTSHHGTIVQHIKLGQRFTALSGQSADQWLTALELRAKALGGFASRLSRQEVLLTIPFHNGADLVHRFNQFFTAAPDASSPTPIQPVDLPTLNPTITLQQTNALLAIRNHLSYDVDLRSLGVVAGDGSQLVDASALLGLQLGLNTPWGATVSQSTTQVEQVEVLQGGRSIVWVLQPGAENHLEVTFWLPNPLGIGTVVILLAAIAGSLLRYQVLQPPTPLPLVPFTE